MTNRKEALTQKVFVLGVDGLDPRYSSKMLREGKMPNLQKQSLFLFYNDNFSYVNPLSIPKVTKR